MLELNIGANCMDDLLARDAIPVPNVIKMDVGGAKSCLFARAIGMLERRNATLLVALHGEPRRCLERAGLQLFEGQRIEGESVVEDKSYAVPAASVG